MRISKIVEWCTVGVVVLTAVVARADVVTDWNAKAGDITAAARMPTPPTYRAMAITQVAVYEAVRAVTGRGAPLFVKVNAAVGASVDAAVAAASRDVLLKLMPDQQMAVEEAYEDALAHLVATEASRARGIEVGQRAASAILALRRDDGADTRDAYRPHTTPGAYVPTTLPVSPHWGKRRPWIMARANQVRPGPPPDLSGDIWARDYNEIKSVGAREGAQRTPEQTEAAHFWETAMPLIYFNVVRSFATTAGRDVTQNARLLAVVGMAMDDALIAVLDAKYAYNFWRPITAIRNGDIDGNAATERDPDWLPLIETPLHPEYPCAHCIVSAAVGTILDALHDADTPLNLSGTSPTAPGAVHHWHSGSELAAEVAEARISSGVHYRNSTEVGAAMGRRIGELAIKAVGRERGVSAATPGS